VERPAQVRLDHDAPVFVRHSRDQAVARHACVVDEDVQLADGVDQCLRLLGVGYVRLDGPRSGLTRNLFGLVLAGAVAERDVRARARELEGDRTPDPTRAAGDEGGLPLERRERVSQRRASPRACRSPRASRRTRFSHCGRFA
jgi:hypothetical protein